MWFPTGCAQAFWERDLQPHPLPACPGPALPRQVPLTRPGLPRALPWVGDWSDALDASSLFFGF